MKDHRLPYLRMRWEQGGHPLERKKVDSGTPATLLEFAPGFADPNWCRRGHTGYVLSGVFRMEFEPEGEISRIEDYAAGEGFHIEAGVPHRASNPGTVATELFVVSTPAPEA